MQDIDNRYKILNRDIMKYLAIIPMFIGHMVAWIALMNDPGNDYALYDLPTGLMVLSSLSLFCPPVMFFFIADGYKYTRNRKKYALRLLLFALITQPFDWLIFQPINGWWTSNVIFTLFFGLLSIIAWESRYKLWQRILLIVLCAAATIVTASDWLVLGVIFILTLHIFRDRPKTRLTVYTSLTLVYFSLNLLSLGKVPTFKLIINILVMISAFMAAYFCMTTFYNGKKGRHPVFAKWFFYAFYPLHYLIIWAVNMCIA
ncbi:MAG: TraX family protein [Huintestinicola sp.]